MLSLKALGENSSMSYAWLLLLPTHLAVVLWLTVLLGSLIYNCDLLLWSITELYHCTPSLWPTSVIPHCGRSVIVAFHSCLSLWPITVLSLWSTVLVYLSSLSVTVHPHPGLSLFHLCGPSLLPVTIISHYAHHCHSGFHCHLMCLSVCVLLLRTLVTLECVPSSLIWTQSYLQKHCSSVQSSTHTD